MNINLSEYLFERAIWIGGKYDTIDEKFKWLDGDEMVWTNWYKGEPNRMKDLLKPEHCIRIQKFSYQFRTSVCNGSYKVLCESYSAVEKSGML